MFEWWKKSWSQMSSKDIKSFVTFNLKRDATTIERKEKQQSLRDTKNLSLLFIFLSCFYLRTFSSNDNKTSLFYHNHTYLFCAQWAVYWNMTPNYLFCPFLFSGGICPATKNLWCNNSDVFTYWSNFIPCSKRNSWRFSQFGKCCMSSPAFSQQNGPVSTPKGNFKKSSLFN